MFERVNRGGWTEFIEVMRRLETIALRLSSVSFYIALFDYPFNY